MERNRLFLGLAGLAAVVVAVGGFFIGVQPQLASASAANTQNETVKTQNVALATATNELRNAFTKLDSLTTQLGVLKKSVPDEYASSDLIREFNSLATSSGVSISQITFSDAQAYTPPVAAATSSDSASTSASSPATAAPAPSASVTTPAAPAVATNSKITAANFSAIPVSVAINGSYAQALEFMKGLHDGSRLFLVTEVGSSVNSDSSSSTTTESQSPNAWTISGLVYALADAQSTNATQQTSTSTAAGTTTPTDGSSSDTAAGK